MEVLEELLASNRKLQEFSAHDLRITFLEERLNKHT